MTVTTLATVGYGEVRPLDASGKLFTISLIVLGVVALAASIDAVAGALVSASCKQQSGGDACASASTASRPTMSSAPTAASGGPPWPSCAPRASPCSWSSLSRSSPNSGGARRSPPAGPTEETALQQAGIQRPRGLLCAMDSDAANVFITLTARALNPALTIVARAANPASVDKLLRAGADHVVSPYDVSGRHMGVLALHPAIVDFLDMAKLAPGLRLEEIEVRSGSPRGQGRGRDPRPPPGRPDPRPPSDRALSTSPCPTTTPSSPPATSSSSLARSKPSRRWPADLTCGTALAPKPVRRKMQGVAQPVAAGGLPSEQAGDSRRHANSLTSTFAPLAGLEDTLRIKSTHSRPRCHAECRSRWSGRVHSPADTPLLCAVVPGGMPE